MTTPIRQLFKNKVLGFHDGAKRQPKTRDEALVLRALAEATGYGGVTICGNGKTTDAPETIAEIIRAVDADGPWPKE